MAEIPPFASLIAWDEQIKLSWAQSEDEAPIPHAELLSLSELAAETKVDVQTMIANLQKDNITEATPDAVVGELAKQHGMTPHELYKIAIGSAAGSASGHPMGAGMGLGKLSLDEFCRQENLELEVALERLRTAGIDAQPTTKLRTIALQHNRKPYEILEIVKGN